MSISFAVTSYNEMTKLQEFGGRLMDCISAVRYYGWIRGNRSDIPVLRKHGVRGEMTFKADDASLLSTIRRAVSKLSGIRYPSGVIEHCECTECVMEHLIEKWPGFWPGCFTGILPPYGDDDQLPRGQQKYWSYPTGG